MRDSSERAALALVLGLCIGIPLVSAIVTGSIAIPHNDDWAFFRILFHLADTGDLRLVGWNEMMFFGQLLWAVPIAWITGPDLAAINVVNASISGVGLILTYRLARRYLPPRTALVVPLAVGLFPGFSALVTTFMTEPSAFAAQLGCLLLGLNAISSDGRRRGLLLAAALLVGLYGFSIREFAIAAPLAVLAGLFMDEIRAKRPPWLSVSGAVAIFLVAAYLYTWRQSLGAGNSHFFGLQLGQLLAIQVAQNMITVGFGLVLPLVVVIVRRRWTLGLAAALGGAALLGLGALALTSSAGEPTCCLGGSGSVFRGNLLTQRGPLGNQVLAGDRPTMPLGIWLLISGLALGSAALVAGRAIESLSGLAKRIRMPAPDLFVITSFGTLTAGAIVFRAVLGGPTFDRYLTPLVLVGTIGLLRSVPDDADWVRSKAALTAAAGLTLFSLAIVAGGHSFDAARWRAAESAVASGIAPGDVDGGFEWVGYHYPGITGEQAPLRSIPHGPGYQYMFPGANNCGVVMSSATSDPRFALMAELDYRSLIALRTERLFIYRFDEACNLAGPS